VKRYEIPRPLVFAALVALLLPGSALAYLDPGTGSFIIQMLVGAVLGGLVAVGVFWRRFKGFVRRLFTKNADDDSRHDDGSFGQGKGGDDQPKAG
jgi:hypothetical protein